MLCYKDTDVVAELNGWKSELWLSAGNKIQIRITDQLMNFVGLLLLKY